ncbi:M20/M25/M40 family metallo-hydrolase [Aquibacillus sp. 3ASR75-11]|uniref:M20/M25/M40 family metallo-hydrolase n=1 Tax=Terrihalobacillus insolitus TaxID=2950438 RepID=A0A9X3WSV9_9BACI|nr:M20/M25/M40 family metallo-hydrolase [Terrihalobacillus insolitus]MDC3414472.1 M20/M25/M40 family metallo-hydrolase [Terrihalobacillus insolitus]MDC3425352.1 M20/M25/M40 family metallo-hydrolase [Terrihalobacillus insolitus]
MKDWQSKNQLTDLLVSLVNYPSITGSESENALAEYLYYLLSDKEYFRKYPQHVKLHPLKDGRQLVTALVKQGDVEDTIVLLSHFDVVGVEDYGTMQNLAFHPRELTDEWYKNIDELPDQVKKDLESGDWLFGRGTMDMKAGLTVHLSMLEKAMSGEFKGNVLLVSVPDEEVNSLGMLTALPVLHNLQKQENLRYKACLNGEPVFSKYPGDDTIYLYTGSIGKTLPGFLCYGKETHVGEPFSGLNPNLMISFLAQELELNQTFAEKVGNEVTPPPISLMQRDLKEEYSVQTPKAAIAMYNVLYMEQTIEEINDKLYQAANSASARISSYFHEKVTHYSRLASNFSVPQFQVHVLMYDQLYREAVSRHGKEEVERRQNLLMTQREKGDREFSTLLVQDLASMCKDLAPMIVLFYSPPFYPAVSSNDDPYIMKTVEKVKQFAIDQFDVSLTDVEYFPGLSDLSFIGPVSAKGKLSSLTKQMPLLNKGFDIPENIMEAQSMPIINIGPMGKDPHQWTERLELTYSFEKLPIILTNAIHTLFEG